MHNGGTEGVVPSVHQAGYSVVFCACVGGSLQFTFIRSPRGTKKEITDYSGSRMMQELSEGKAHCINEPSTMTIDLDHYANSQGALFCSRSESR
jgi:hypothetical protein